MIAARIIGHRGAASLAPENTLAGIRVAAERGVSWVEVDVRLLGDGTPVIHHDQTVDRCSDGNGALSEYDRHTIRRLDAGRWYGDELAGERIPLLSEALALACELGLGVNLELKLSDRSTAQGLAGAVVSAVRAVTMPRAQLLVSSFDSAVLKASRARDSQLLIGCLWSRLPASWRQRAADVGAVSIHCDWQYLTQRAVRLIKAAGLDLYCYTVNDPQTFLHYWDWGVDGIFTDRPQDFLLSR